MCHVPCFLCRNNSLFLVSVGKGGLKDRRVPQRNAPHWAPPLLELALPANVTAVSSFCAGISCGNNWTLGQLFLQVQDGQKDWEGPVWVCILKLQLRGNTWTTAFAFPSCPSPVGWLLCDTLGEGLWSQQESPHCQTNEQIWPCTFIWFWECHLIRGGLLGKEGLFF